MAIYSLYKMGPDARLESMLAELLADSREE